MTMSIPRTTTLFTALTLSTMFAEPLEYPESKRTDFKDVLHGVEVPDPYRWLEEIDSEPVNDWVERQAAFAKSHLEKLPGREKLEKRLTELWDYEKHGLPYQMGGRLFYTRNSGLQNQSVLYWREDKPEAIENLLLDPNTLSEEGTTALSGYSISEDGKYMAYGVSKSGSDWQEWKVREIVTGKDTSDHLKGIKFSGAEWSPDHQGFLYSRYNPSEAGDLKEANVDQKVYHHRLGDPQEKDTLIYDRPDHPQWILDGGYTEDGRYLIISVFTGAGSKNGLFYKDLKAENGEFVELLQPALARYSLVDNDGPIFTIYTDDDAPAGRLIAMDTRKPDRANWHELIPERSDAALQNVSSVGDVLIAQYLKDVLPEVIVFNRLGMKLREVPMKELGSAVGFGGRAEDRETFYTLSGYTNPGRIYRYDLGTGESELFWEPKLLFNPDDFVTKQEFFKSKDGTRVPLFLVHRKDVKLDGTAPTFLYGYGGFDINLTPRFQISNLVWMDQGGVFALANLRGGGEYGQAWHEAGMKEKKQNVFDDFIGAGEWLIANKVTSSKHLAIGGGSNGGLLTAACMNQRPELFGACWSAVGVQDMLRFHKFTIGWAWQDEYGHVVKEADFKNLFSYSPYHNVKKGAHYPPTLVTTADHDDRVFPAHSFKYGAALQHAQGGDAPIILRIETKAGHGAGKPTAKVIEEVADRWAFLGKAIGLIVE
ncbi:MAG: prolyl oligopeptidase [Verrucomicrobiales bacterium]|jgi:prolyl oligopeptidase